MTQQIYAITEHGLHVTIFIEDEEEHRERMVKEDLRGAIPEMARDYADSRCEEEKCGCVCHPTKKS